MHQIGGYPKGYKLKKPESQNRPPRLERTFTRVFEDGTTRGNYVGYDYRRPGNIRLQGTSWIVAAKKAYRQYCTEYRKRTGEDQCLPQIVLLRETTPGNNKYDFSYRQRQYYIQNMHIEPKKIGKKDRIYRFIPKVYPMRLGESLEDFKNRKIKKISP